MPAITKPARIIELRAENFKRLTAITIRPVGNVTQITGKNGQGKSSVLDAIFAGLAGKEAIQSVPIRKGAAEAIIKLDLGEVRVIRKFKNAKEGEGYTTELIVESMDGARFTSPQKILDEVIGTLALDPLAFQRSKPTEQFETLKALIPGLDFAAIEAANNADYNKRTDVARRAREATAQANGISIPDGTPGEPIDESAILDEIQAGAATNQGIEQEKSRRAGIEASRVRSEAAARHAREQAASLRAQADRAEASAVSEEAEATSLAAVIAGMQPIPEYVDLSALRQRAGTAKNTNLTVASAKRKADLLETATKLTAEAEALTAAMTARDKTKQDTVKAAKLPIEGLGLGDKVVTMNGLPFDQASDAEQLRVSIAIAAAMNPTLRVIRVRDGSLLDDDAMKMLEAFADEHDVQVWIERVDGSGKVGFVLVDGHLQTEGEKA